MPDRALILTFHLTPPTMPPCHMNLQLFGERSEPATPRRRQKARERGQVLQSQEVTSAVMLLATFLALRAIAPAIWNGLADYLRETLANLSAQDITVADLTTVFLRALAVGAKGMWPLLVVALAAALISGFAQTGFAFSLTPLSVQFSRIDPLKGFQRLFSRRSFVAMGKSLLKLILIGWVAWSALRGSVDLIPGLMTLDLGGIVFTIAKLSGNIILKVALVWAIIAAADYYYEHYEYEQSLRMTKQEIKQEQREQEGDPQIRARIRRRQRELATRRMMAEVAKADVVITNPTHYAVALRYDAPAMAAPQVVGKGQGYIAERIKQLAKDKHITTVENVPLAQGLYKAVEVGQAVPPQFYQAVAEVLAYVYRLKGRIS